jgi:hypothetical protein
VCTGLWCVTDDDSDTGSGGADVVDDKSEWAAFPPEALYRPWPEGSYVDRLRFLLPAHTAVTGAAAFLAAQGTGSFSLPWEDNMLGPQRKVCGP